MIEEHLVAKKNLLIHQRTIMELQQSSIRPVHTHYLFRQKKDRYKIMRDESGTWHLIVSPTLTHVESGADITTEFIAWIVDKGVGRHLYGIQTIQISDESTDHWTTIGKLASRRMVCLGTHVQFGHLLLETATLTFDIAFKLRDDVSLREFDEIRAMNMEEIEQVMSGVDYEVLIHHVSILLRERTSKQIDKANKLANDIGFPQIEKSTIHQMLDDLLDEEIECYKAGVTYTTGRRRITRGSIELP